MSGATKRLAYRDVSSKTHRDNDLRADCKPIYALPPLTVADQRWLRACLQDDPVSLVAAYSGRPVEEIDHLLNFEETAS